ncbi:putative leucine-rich repeat domain superfamily [Helianthus annuus]|uniref:Leucine-rich repeat domain superfamily n=1 Tax=Helianthus annuus TaxID=4232 RepID=A0A251TJZ5_HELAN|nr:plant intracellular Ras-group-related LRR protein 9 [Helianthus annuus]KAF5792869.1 putative leucine-rich repeat domain superfamily [Helianthus annuus]KAJ0527768.1 putative leucine-rich repeat domain superfamily [Helianthus annuus]KAJ0544184.1 putative leucine-rich repeat domain superfamily [Helianthus annuus]KAJ0709218.1 putative leucine-rich repeat domain superfamily [Helianthus annuus]KAJ0713095.1 putative leucine-rich repeat domain superfamily [Helianthus annuus]
MDPNPSPRKMRILKYVMTKIPSFKRRQLQELENERLARPYALPETYTELSERESYTELAERVSHLTEDDILANIRAVVVEVKQIRSVIKSLGDRPDPETVDLARLRYAEAESPVAGQFDENAEYDMEMEKRKRLVKRERQMYKALISLDEMHETYSDLLVVAERRLQKLYDTAKSAGKLSALDKRVSSMLPTIAEEVKEEMADILQDALMNGVERIDLSRRRLPFVPEAFGKLHTLVSLDLSSNKLTAIPESLAGLTSLEELNLSANLFESLPDTIGSLQHLQFLNVSRNKLTSLPDGICKCRSLLELDASFNQITYLPANIGYGLINLKKLIMPLNKLRSLPTSIGEMISLQVLDVHFNTLRGLPPSIGMLKKLEVLNLGSNFNDFTALPETIGSLTRLRELDICNNQIQQLPITFGRLVSLTRLVVDHNPLTVPPPEVVAEGVEAVKVYMSKRLYDMIVEEERRVMWEREEQAQQAGWFTFLFFGPAYGPGATYPYLTHRL